MFPAGRTKRPRPSPRYEAPTFASDDPEAELTALLALYERFAKLRDEGKPTLSACQRLSIEIGKRTTLIIDRTLGEGPAQSVDAAGAASTSAAMAGAPTPALEGGGDE